MYTLSMVQLYTILYLWSNYVYFIYGPNNVYFIYGPIYIYFIYGPIYVYFIYGPTKKNAKKVEKNSNPYFFWVTL